MVRVHSKTFILKKRNLFLFKNFTFYCLFKFFKHHFLFFLVKKSSFFLSFKLIKFFFSPSLYKEFALFLKFSHFFKYSQVLDLLSYKITHLLKDVLVGIFFLTTIQFYLITFTLNFSFKKINILLTSLENIFFNFWWLEREVSEMTGFIFKNKIDSRNLLLEYFTFFFPLNPSFPSFGFFELYFNLIIGFLTFNFTSAQI